VERNQGRAVAACRPGKAAGTGFQTTQPPSERGSPAPSPTHGRGSGART
jgi:hypothetical protein